MSSARSYKKALSAEAARQELVQNSGTQFDPEVVRAFLNVGLERTRRASGVFGLAAELPRMLSTLGTGVAHTTGTAVVTTPVAVSSVALPLVVVDSMPAGAADAVVEFRTDSQPSADDFAAGLVTIPPETIQPPLGPPSTPAPRLPRVTRHLQVQTQRQRPPQPPRNRPPHRPGPPPTLRAPIMRAAPSSRSWQTTSRRRHLHHHWMTARIVPRLPGRPLTASSRPSPFGYSHRAQPWQLRRQNDPPMRRVRHHLERHVRLAQQ
jgi:hypothetical protein